jgi:TolA-binding protein
MKTLRTILLFQTFIILINFPVIAQETEFFNDVEEDIQIAADLFRRGRYSAAYLQYEKVQQQVDPKSEIYSEALYFKSVSAMKAGYSSGYKMLEKFISEHPESPYIGRAWFNLGDYQFDKRHYPAVLTSYSHVDNSALDENEQITLKYQSGYSNLMMENNDQAIDYFYDIKDKNHIYSRPATYYWAHLMYLDENYQSALEGFSKLNGDLVYSRFIPVYVSHIYYKQQKYNEVVNYTTGIIDDVEEEHKSELSKIIGDSYFHLREYENAIPYLEFYYETPGSKTREDNYILGYCYYDQGRYDKAVPLLENASKGKDEMAQNAYYHLADSYIKLDEKEKARVAFEAASQFDFNERIKEDALFSFAKLTYELSYSPFNETIKAFERYISLYPDSERNTEAYRYLTEVFMVTRNYSDAINAIEKIEVKSTEIKRAYQRVTFYRGLELFNNLAYNQAIDYFDISLENGSHDRELNARALFWKAEALYRVGDYQNSVASYSEFLNTPGAFSLAEFKDAEYNLGYAYFKLKDYRQAALHFRNYINSLDEQRTEKVADAFNRVGDYYFFNTDYSSAGKNYRKAYDMKIFEPDYSLYQIAFCLGLQQDQQGKINSLELLRTDFPDSDYADDAIYELGRTHERMGNNSQAILNYKYIISKYPESFLYKKALLQLGLINYNSGDMAKALEQYKEVVEKFPGTQESQTALLGIKNCYVEMNNIDAYFDYNRNLGSGASVTTSERDSLTYMAAERLYMSGNERAADQLQKYLQEFPNGSFAINAHFYLADLLYKDGSYARANEHYLYVAGQPNNIFSEQALSKSSELTFNAGMYSEALDLFDKLESVANSKWNILKAYTGQMRCHFRLDHYKEAIEAANKVINYKEVNEAWLREANYISGKSYFLSGDLNRAISPLKEVATDTKLEQGAEAKFLISGIYYRQNNVQKAEDEIMDFISKGTPFQYWLGKAFLLLADIYTGRNDLFQAKHTLRSVVENYSVEDDGIKAEAKEKLNEIETREQIEQQEARDSSFQLKINNN